MPDSRYIVRPVTQPVVGRIRPPGSKSITNRALVCAALARGTSTLTDGFQFELDVRPCDGGVCLSEIPCHDGSVFTAGSGCRNPDYRTLPILVRARANLTE